MSFVLNAVYRNRHQRLYHLATEADCQSVINDLGDDNWEYEIVPYADVPKDTGHLVSSRPSTVDEIIRDHAQDMLYIEKLTHNEIVERETLAEKVFLALLNRGRDSRDAVHLAFDAATRFINKRNEERSK